jgi:hypothetical protein
MQAHRIAGGILYADAAAGGQVAQQEDHPGSRMFFAQLK